MLIQMFVQLVILLVLLAMEEPPVTALLVLGLKIYIKALVLAHVQMDIMLQMAFANLALHHAPHAVDHPPLARHAPVH
jgi:hypothetical protein